MTAKPRPHKYAWSLAIATVLTALMVVLPNAWYLPAPGMVAAAIPFPEGIEGNFPEAYMIVGLLMNVFIYSWVVFGIWTLIEHARRRE